MRCLLASLRGLLLRESGMMLLRRRLCPGPLLLLGVALCLFYQTLNVARSRFGSRQQPDPRVHSPEQRSNEQALEDSRRFISALETLQSQVQLVFDIAAQHHRALVLTGQHVVTDTEVQLYQRVLQQMKYEIQLSRYAETSSLLRPKQGVSGWSLLLCLSSSETSCLRRVSFTELQSHQRVNLLPPMMKAFSDAGDGLCHLFTHPELSESKLPMKPYSCGLSNLLPKKSTSANSLTKPIVPSQSHGAVVNVYVLVTSINPLTSFLHHTCTLTTNAEQRGQLTRLQSLRPDDVGYTASYQTMMGHLKRVLGDVLQAAASTYEKDQTVKSCLLCYQLLTFTLLFNGSLTPTIIQVDTDWTFSALSDQTFEQKITKDLMLEDTLNFLLKSQIHLSSVTKALSKGDGGCPKILGVCLSKEDLLLSLQFYQQIKLPLPFQLLYPNTNLCSTSVNPRSVFDLLVKTFCYYELQQNHRQRTNNSGMQTNHEDTQSMLFLKEGNAACVDPRLRQIYTDPPLSMTPPFDPGVKEYRVEVPFDTVMIRIRPEPIRFNCHVHLDEHRGPSMANLPIGLGKSRVSILVTDGGKSEAVMTIYTLHVFRENRPSLPMFGDHVMCSFMQECGLLVQPGQSCGLKPFNISQSPPQPCSSGDKPGRWVVPCLSCLDNRTCDWREIAWQPDNCYYPLVDQHQVQSCMADRKLLFIGDSTNRGMMYFLMERVNSSLQDWEKAHDTLVYTNLNGGQTLVSYSYYPQFWLETSQRPTFLESLEKLLFRSQPLLNSKQTVLIVGGVQWLNTNHLRVIRESLDKKGLNNILVVVKSLGMGFHLPVDGIRSLSLSGIQDLYRENQNLMMTATKYGYEVIDTFSITMGRYKEFLQGRCACHFHEVEKLGSSKTSYDTTTKANGTRFTKLGQYTVVDSDHGKGSDKLSYSVKGPVNQVYSEILLSRLCPAN